MKTEVRQVFEMFSTVGMDILRKVINDRNIGKTVKGYLNELYGLVKYTNENMYKISRVYELVTPRIYIHENFAQKNTFQIIKSKTMITE
jgi:hypothetical protein